MKDIEKIHDMYLHEGFQVSGSKKESTHVMRVIGGLMYQTFIFNGTLESAGENISMQFVPYDGFLRHNDGDLKDPSQVAGTSIDELDLTVRAKTCLRSEQMHTIEQLESFLKRRGVLRRIPNLGNKTKVEIMEALGEWERGETYFQRMRKEGKL